MSIYPNERRSEATKNFGKCLQAWKSRVSLVTVLCKSHRMLIWGTKNELILWPFWSEISNFSCEISNFSCEISNFSCEIVERRCPPSPHLTPRQLRCQPPLTATFGGCSPPPPKQKSLDKLTSSCSTVPRSTVHDVISRSRATGEDHQSTGGLATHGSSPAGLRSSCHRQQLLPQWQNGRTSRTLWVSWDEASHCPPSPGHWDAMVSKDDTPGRSPWKPKDTSSSASSLPATTWMTLRTTGGKSSGRTRPNLDCLVTIPLKWSGVEQGRHSSLTIPFPQWSKVVAASCCGGASLAVAQDILSASGGPWMLCCLQRSSRIFSSNQCGSFICTGASCSSRTMTPNTLPKSSRHGLGMTTLTCWSGPTSPQTLTPSRICAHSPKTLDGLETCCMEEWDNIPAETCANAVVNYRKRLVEVIVRSHKMWVVFLFLWFGMSCTSRISARFLLFSMCA